MSDPVGFAVLAVAAFVAGVMNSIAGGGTLLTFPALMAVLTPVYGPTAAAVANATSTVALLPGSLAGTWGYRREFAPAREFALRMLPPSLAGGLVGSLLLVLFPGHFTPLVPWLILTAAVLFLIQPLLTRLMARWRTAAGVATHVPPGAWMKLEPLRQVRRRQTAMLVGFQFLVAVYGGYFGAGIGILMLTALSLMGLQSIHQANAVKTLLASVINGVSVVVFVAGGLVDWKYAAVMAAAAVLGGYAGARVARRLPAKYVRWLVVAVGFGLAGYYAWKQLFTHS
jgi:uncharacterized membrane protein YfcA